MQPIPMASIGIRDSAYRKLDNVAGQHKLIKRINIWASIQASEGADQNTRNNRNISVTPIEQPETAEDPEAGNEV